jgi:predicted RNA-binding Zn-ribbon protein involved in translation (DUF1610 family)
MNFLGKTGERMRCPGCGGMMNCHANKILYFKEGGEIRSTESSTGGFVEEIHACPNCGASASRPASN